MYSPLQRGIKGDLKIFVLLKMPLFKKPFLPYDKNNKTFSRQLRNDSTLSEVLLWNELKGGKMRGYKFNRQKPLANYIVDFYCKKLNLVIEVDGYSHDFKHAEDIKRDTLLESMGLAVIRIDDMDVKKDMINVLRTIEAFIEKFESQEK